MEILKKTELVNLCNELGIKKCKSKNKGELLALIKNWQKNANSYSNPVSNPDSNPVSNPVFNPDSNPVSNPDSNPV